MKVYRKGQDLHQDVIHSRTMQRSKVRQGREENGVINNEESCRKIKQDKDKGCPAAVALMSSLVGFADHHIRRVQL